MDTLHTDIIHCARCEQDHPGLDLFPLKNHERFTHYATCPTTGQPIMVRVRDSQKEPVQ